MKRSLRTAMAVMAMAIALPLFSSLLISDAMGASPQSRRSRESMREILGPNNEYLPNYQQGLKFGQHDRANNRPFHYHQRDDPRNNDPLQNRAFEAGYDEGYGRSPSYDSARRLPAGTRPNFEQGLRDGQHDRANNNPFRYRYLDDPRNVNVEQNRAYEAGYNEGYGRTEAYGRGSGRDNRRFGRNVHPATTMGFEDGVRDGEEDRQAGHSYRPTYGRNYRRATNGYSAGDQSQYRTLYREGYTAGYDRGYRGR